MLPHSNILGQDMNLVSAPQCLTSKGQQHVAPEGNLREHTPLLSANKAEPTLALKPREDVTRHTCMHWDISH